MGRHAEVQIKWADGEHTFRLAIGQLRELQEKTDAGPLQIYRRFLIGGDWRVDDVREVIRLGLIGGGMPPLEALKLVERYVDERPLLESVTTAQAILGVVLMPVEDDPIEKKKDQTTNGAATASSPSPTSTEQEQPSAYPQEMSTI